MRFKRIEFTNYRCFDNGAIEFAEHPEEGRNINLVFGSNGCGKTELLFSFTWALWGYDFKKLSGKEQTPWPLSARLYRALQEGCIGASEKCSVEVLFEERGTAYRMIHAVMFTKEGSRVKQGPDEYSFSWTDEHGEYVVPLHTRDKINPILNKVIPLSTLSGISFDGERMQRLSQITNESKATVKSVIDNITRADFFDSAASLFDGLHKDVVNTIKKRKARRRLSLGNEQNLDQLQLSIEESSGIVDQKEQEIATLAERIARLEDDKAHISVDLEEINKSRELIGSRKECERRAGELEKNLGEREDDFRTTMQEKGYLLFSGKLLDDVRAELKESDVPTGITAQAVQELLDSGRCICGETLDDAHRENLRRLIELLPPLSINGTLRSYVDTVDLEMNKAKVQLRENSSSVRRVQKELEDNEARLQEIRRQLEGVDDERVKQLYGSYVGIEVDLKNAKEEQKRAEQIRDRERDKLEKLAEKREAIARGSLELDDFSRRKAFLEKARIAIVLIRDRQRQEALKTINDNLQRAYATVSEDARNGRSLWLVQSDRAREYQMVPYYRDQVEEFLAREGKTWDAANIADRERAVLACGESNSTGQSKINTFAFVRSILDFANAEKGAESFQLSRSYPLLIDAPFGDIFDDNLLMSSRELHSFADQIILMLARQSYEGVSREIGPYVSRCVELIKNEGKGLSSIQEAAI